MKTAGAFFREGIFYFYSGVTTTEGVGKFGSPFIAIGAGNNGEIGQIVLMVINASRKGVPHPKPGENFLKPFLDLVRTKTINAFSKVAQGIWISQEDSQIIFTPLRRVSPKNYFEPIEGKKIFCSLNAEEIGEKLLLAFKPHEP